MCVNVIECFYPRDFLSLAVFFSRTRIRMITRASIHTYTHTCPDILLKVQTSRFPTVEIKRKHAYSVIGLSLF